MGKFVEKRVKLVEITLVVALAFGFTWIIPEKPAMASALAKCFFFIISYSPFQDGHDL